MLAELVRYARGKALDVEAGFRPKGVKWLLLFKPDGTFVDVRPYGGDKYGKRVAKCPHVQFSGDTPMRQFLVDTAAYLAFLGGEAGDIKLRRKHAYALDLLARAGAAVPELARIATSMAKPETVAAIGQKLAATKAKPADNVTPVILAGGELRIFVEETSWHDWWRSFFPTLLAGKGGAAVEEPSARCLASGEPCVPALTHPKVRGLGDVGGKVETALVSFNQTAFCSYGLEQSANSPVSADAANAYVGALNDLIENSGQRLGNVKIVHWFAGKDDRPVEFPAMEDPFRLLDAPAGESEPAPESAAAPKKVTKGNAHPEADRRRQEMAAQAKARAFLQSVRSGERKTDLGEYRYYALTLSGSSARVMVRDFVTGRFGGLCGNVESWFADFEIVHRGGDGLAPSPKFAAVLGAMYRDLKDVPPPVTAKLWRCAIHGDEIPQAFAVMALNRAVIDLINGDTPRHARMGLLRAYLCRTQKERLSVTPHLNEDHPDPAYHCGRLLAILDDIQYAALGDVGAGVVQRFYAAASATPALVFGRLIRLANTGHLPKIDGGLQRWHTQRLARAWGQLAEGPPVTLTLEQQTLFAMGFYQQKAQRNTPEKGKD